MSSIVPPDDPRVAAWLAEWSRRRVPGQMPTPGELPEDPALREAVEKAAAVTLFIESASGLVDPPPPPEARGVPGRYQILDKVGEGGMGVVYRAEDLTLRCVVAYKVIKDHLAVVPRQRRKFLREARITASLQHAGVVPIHDLTSDGDGRPAYAMRLVEGGITLDEAVARFHAGPAPAATPRDWQAILGHFLRICSAIDHAHGRGVLHRDLAPRNLMVRGDETFVIDWGLAVRVDGPDVDAEDDPWPEAAAPQTRATRDFSAPEVLARGSFSRQSDVYSLGALLRLILTGKPPGAAPAPGTSPSPPGPPPALAAIADRAMSREPAGRYPSPKALAEEVQRWLNGEPVRAYRYSRAERLRLWANRHRPAFRLGAAGLVAVAVASPIALVRESGLRADADAASEQADRERKAAVAASERAERAVEEIISQAESIGAMQATLPASKAVLDRAVRILEDLARVQGDDPSHRFAVASYFFRAGKIRSNLSQIPESEALHARAATLLEALCRESPADATIRHLWARALRECGVARGKQGRLAAAKLDVLKGIEVLGPIVGPGSDPAFRHTLAKLDLALGTIAFYSWKYGEAHEVFARGVGLASAVVAEVPTDLTCRFTLADLFNNQGMLLMAEASGPRGVLRNPAKLGMSREAHLNALQVRQRLVDEEPGNPIYMSYLAGSYNHLANTYQVEGEARFGDAEAAYAKAYELLEPLAFAFPGDPGNGHEMARIYNNTFELMTKQGRLEQLETTARKAVAAFERIAKAAPTVGENPAALGMAHEKLADALRRRGDAAGAREQDYLAAVQYARSATLLKDEPIMAGPPASKAIEALSRLRDEGYFNDPGRRDALRADPAFEYLKSRKDFGEFQ